MMLPCRMVPQLRPASIAPNRLARPLSLQLSNEQASVPTPPGAGCSKIPSVRITPSIKGLASRVVETSITRDESDLNHGYPPRLDYGFVRRNEMAAVKAAGSLGFVNLTERVSRRQCGMGVIRTEGILLHPHPEDGTLAR